MRSQARSQSDLVAATAADLLARPSRTQLTTLARTAAATVHGRVLIVDSAGRVLVDSLTSARVGSSYESRPELERALDGHPVQVQRPSRTLGQQILATAVPILHDGRIAGAVRITQSVGAVHRAVLRVELELLLIGVVVLTVGLLAGALLAGQIGRPLRRLEAMARRVAQGDLRARAAVEGSTEQRSLALSFNEMTARIERLLGAQRAFVADASHQLRTPLTGLRLRLEEAKALAGQDGDAAAGELDAAISEVDRLANTVEELLHLSSGGERRVEGAAVGIDDLAAAAVARWMPAARERAIALELRPQAGAATVWAARADLERALDALIENALRYSPPHAVVTIRSAATRIEVNDTGPGIPPEERQLVLERFHRGRAGRSGPSGHGLGLAIARELAREWGGDILLQDRSGGGTTAVLAFAGDDGRAERLTDGFARA